MDKFDIAKLLAKYQRNECTNEEIQLLHDWISHGSFDNSEVADIDILKDLQTLESKLPLLKPKKIFPFQKALRYAASVVILLALGYYINSFISKDTRKEKTVNTSNYQAGSNKAILMFDNDKSIALDDSTAENRVIEIDGALVEINKDGQLKYLTPSNTKHPQINEIITPKGGQYELILPDGTHVWLNAESKLSFLNDFRGLPQRSVQLEGEAYFKVTPNREQPFVVSVNGQHIKVLGTEFNVNAYKDNNFIKTSLLEGSVLFNNSRLSPGESAVFINNTTTIQQDNMDDVTAWKNGYFIFFNENLESVMKKICRWYDLETLFLDHDSKQITIGGSISKYEDATKVFKMIEKAGNVRIQTKGTKILINKI